MTAQFLFAGHATGDGRLLTPDALAGIAADVAARPALWEPLLDTRATVRTYASLHREPDLEIWAIAWLPDNDTGWHDHESSSGAVRVVEGALDEHVLRLGGADRRSVHGAGGDLHLRARSHPPRDLLGARAPSPSTSTPPRSGGSGSTRSTRTACCTA